MKMVDTNTLCAGIDVGKEWLDVAVAATPEHERFANTDEGRLALLAWLKRRGIGRVGLEASGGYERRLVACLHKAQVALVRFQPRQVRSFANFLNRKAKTDAIDAQVIALCAKASGMEQAPPHPLLVKLAEHMTFLEQVEEDMVRCKTRIEGFTEALLKRRLESGFAALKDRRASLIKAIQAKLLRDDALQQRLSLILSVPGIGLRTALALLIFMPELGTMSREQAASLLGVAPFDRQSGKHDGLRHIAGGRARPRRSLFAAALPAAFQHNPALVSLYKRLREAGKSHKVALIACVRKLVIYVNTVLARGTPWIKADA
jgi:transposase